MTTPSTQFRIDVLVRSMGQAGRRLRELEACEGAAGNISLAIRGPLDVRARFPSAEPIALPSPVPSLAGATVITTGSGCRLRDLLEEPEANLGAIVVGEDGRSGTLWSAPEREYARPTSELSSHLSVHAKWLPKSETGTHALVHAHAPHLTFLSHIDEYSVRGRLNVRLMRWEPETVIFLPEGIGMAGFQVPGTLELMAVTENLFESHQVVVWAKHGVVARYWTLPGALDRIEYAEAAARYEYMRLVSGSRIDGLSDDEIRAVCRFHNVNQSIL
jgi:rhamnulose-1-phosphate aldolase